MKRNAKPIAVEPQEPFFSAPREPIFIVESHMAQLPLDNAAAEAIFAPDPDIKSVDAVGHFIANATSRYEHKKRVVFAELAKRDKDMTHSTVFGQTNKHGSVNEPYVLPESKLPKQPYKPLVYRKIEHVKFTMPNCGSCEFNDASGDCPTNYFQIHQQCPLDKAMYFAELWLRRQFSEGCDVIVTGNFVQRLEPVAKENQSTKPRPFKPQPATTLSPTRS